MLTAGLMKDVHAMSDNTFVVVRVVVAPIPSLSIPFDHIVLSLVINFLETPKFKDVLIRIEALAPVPPLGVADCPFEVLSVESLETLDSSEEICVFNAII
jgi:hypothetical protein